MNKTHLTDTVSVNKVHLTDTVSVNMMHLTDTEPVKKMQLICNLSVYKMHLTGTGHLDENYIICTTYHNKDDLGRISSGFMMFGGEKIRGEQARLSWATLEFQVKVRSKYGCANVRL